MPDGTTGSGPTVGTASGRVVGSSGISEPTPDSSMVPTTMPAPGTGVSDPFSTDPCSTDPCRADPLGTDASGDPAADPGRPGWPARPRDS